MAGEDKTATTTAATGDTTTAATTTAAATGDTKTAAATAATTEAKDPTTLLSDTGDAAAMTATSTTTAAATGDWAADWREKMAGGNDKALNVLKRFSSPQTVANALLADRQRMSEGKLRATLPDDATPEQIVQYRKANGIPEKPEAYLEKLPDGLVIGEADKAGFALLAERMHALNAPPAVVHEAVKVYNEARALEEERMFESNERFKEESLESLIAEYGPGFNGTRNAVKGLIESMPNELGKRIMEARGPDGHYLMAGSEMFKFLAQVAIERNPSATVVGGAAFDNKVLISELETIEKTMKTDLNAYRRDPKMQARYGELLEARDRMKSSGRAA